MVKSMTGYGRGVAVLNDFRFVIEIKAVNHRHFDLVIRASRDLLPMEDKIRRMLLEKISRGRVEVFVTLETIGGKGKKVSVDKGLASSYLQCLQETGKIEERGPLFLDKYRERLNVRLEELHEGKEYDRQRFFTEVAFFAERCNVDEEVVRMKSHLQAFYKETQNGGVIGRKLDFILQEMHREINTIASKSSDLEISHLTVEAKSEIEKIREQVQNIE